MLWTILAATVAFLMAIFIAARYERHVSSRNRVREENAAEMARILFKQELD